MSPISRQATLEPGRVIAGKFRLTREIGQGGMGAVWAAVHQALGREVAVKFLQPHVEQNASVAERFVSEARMVASIKHRFVVDVFDFGVTEDGLYYMVLELLHGSSLAERMDRGPAMPLALAVQLIADCMRGLAAVHDAGIVHRDLKPDNIFLIEDADGAFPKLIDFGISKRTEATDALTALTKLGGKKSRLTQPGMVVGTPYYMSPEQLRGRNNLDRRSDVYSVGVILYELLSGRLPFEQDNVGDLMVAITVHGAAPLTSLRPELGPALSAVVAKALSAEPSARYANALELRDALLACLPSLPADVFTSVQSAVAGRRVAQPSPPLPAARVSPPPPRPAWQLSTARGRNAAVVAATVMLALMVIWLLYKPEPEPSVIPLHVQHVEPHVEKDAKLTTPAAVPRVAPTRPPVVAPPSAPSSTVNRPAVDEEQAVKSTVNRAPANATRRSAPSVRRAPPAAAPNRGDKPQKLYRKLDF